MNRREFMTAAVVTTTGRKPPAQEVRRLLIANRLVDTVSWFFFLSAWLMVMAQHPAREESVTASATWDTTPRVGVVLSNFKGAEDHDGTKIAGLPDPRPVTAELTFAQLDAMLHKALELGVRRHGGLAEIVGRDERLLILVGPQTDGRLIRSLLAWFSARRAGERIILAGAVVDGFESVDLAAEMCIEKPVPGKSGTYCIAKSVEECDKLITIAAMRTDPVTGVALSMANHWAITRPEARHPGSEAEVLVDLSSIRPADYSIVCGTNDHHNVIVAGPNPVAVDSVAASIMGFDPAGSRFLDLASRRGLGQWVTDAIWIRGNEISEATRLFPKPVGWPPQPRKEK
jgi:hypothetical protein